MDKEVIFSGEGLLNTKLRRQADIKKKNKANEFAAYRSNTTKEELCFEYTTSLANQFVNVNPNRKIPFFNAENEFGVKKFLPTAIKPTQISFAELYDLHECASYFSGYVQYEPLDPAFEPPKCVFSPTQTLSSHIGDSFDLSTLLVSFLLGIGYDAYVVNGYAPKYITLKDQSNTLCPMISGPKEIPKVLLMIPESPMENEQVTNEIVDTGYTIIDNSIKDSTFIKEENDKKIEASKDLFRLWIQDEYVAREKTPPQAVNASQSNGRGKSNNYVDIERQRVHAWVMVVAGRRDVKETVFIEPSTGRVYNANNCPYYGIESIWNNQNYWMNIQSYKNMNEIDFDLFNGQIWESVFIDTNNHRPGTADGNMNTNSSNLTGPSTSATSSSTTTSSQVASSSNNANANPNASILHHGIRRVFDSPPSYVNALSFTRNDYMRRFPSNGQRHIRYFCSKVDYFAPGVNSQCMVMRITLYLDVACTIVKEVHEWFENRKDKLYKRSRFLINEVHSIEYYHPGSTGEIRQWTEYPSKRIIIDFYVNGNLDRIKQRDEWIGDKVIEYYEGRTDHLLERIIEFTKDKTLVGTRTFPLPGNGLCKELYITSMKQVYERDHSVQPGEDIYTRNYYIPEGKLVCKYHFKPGSITNTIKTYFHTRVGLSNSAANINEHSVLQEIGLDDNVDKLQEASSLERECYTSVRTSFQSIVDIVNKRQLNETTVLNERSVYESAIDKANEMLSNNSNSMNGNANNTNNNNANMNFMNKTSDYLTPFLRNYAFKDINTMTREEALEIRQNCLDAMKSRLIERANIIQSRLNDENTKLGRKQEQFQRSQREGDLSTEEYEKYCTEAMFRIQILEKRLIDHEESSLKKFAELDAKLANDHRLKVLRV